MLKAGPAIAAATRFLPVAWRRAWAALALACAGVCLALHFGGGWWPAAMLATLSARGGVLRLALDEGRPGPGGLQLGLIEARLAAVWGLTVLLLAILAALVFVVLLASAYAVASAGAGFDPKQVATWAPAIEPRGRSVLAFVAAAGAAGVAWAWTRTSLAEAASLAEGRIAVLRSWRRTRAVANSLLVAQLVVAAPVLLAWFAAPMGGWVWVASVGVAFGGLWLPMNVGLMAYAMRTIG